MCIYKKCPEQAHLQRRKQVRGAQAWGRASGVLCKESGPLVGGGGLKTRTPPPCGAPTPCSPGSSGKAETGSAVPWLLHIRGEGPCGPLRGMVGWRASNLRAVERARRSLRLPSLGNGTSCLSRCSSARPAGSAQGRCRRSVRGERCVCTLGGKQAGADRRGPSPPRPRWLPFRWLEHSSVALEVPAYLGTSGHSQVEMPARG